MRAVVTCQSNTTQQPVAGLKAQADGEVLNEIRVLANENLEGTTVGVGPQIQITASLAMLGPVTVGWLTFNDGLGTDNQIMDILVSHHDDPSAEYCGILSHTPNRTVLLHLVPVLVVTQAADMGLLVEQVA